MNPSTQTSRVLTSQHRNAGVQAAYMEHITRKNQAGDTSCDMCRLITDRQVQLELPQTADNTAPVFETVCIIENEFPYENNDGRKVELHHMIVPKAHYSKATELPLETQAELHATLDYLLDSGTYDSAYTRSTYSPTSSVPLHLHTHLFKFGPKVTRQLFDPANNLNEISFEDS